jgi:hypothetical protein
VKSEALRGKEVKGEELRVKREEVDVLLYSLPLYSFTLYPFTSSPLHPSPFTLCPLPPSLPLKNSLQCFTHVTREREIASQRAIRALFATIGTWQNAIGAVQRAI